jgi:hypothetical protein
MNFSRRERQGYRFELHRLRNFFPADLDIATGNRSNQGRLVDRPKNLDIGVHAARDGCTRSESDTCSRRQPSRFGDRMFFNSVRTKPLATSCGRPRRSVTTFSLPSSSVVRTVTWPVEPSIETSIVGCWNAGPFCTKWSFRSRKLRR